MSGEYFRTLNVIFIRVSQPYQRRKTFSPKEKIVCNPLTKDGCNGRLAAAGAAVTREQRDFFCVGKGVAQSLLILKKAGKVGGRFAHQGTGHPLLESEHAIFPGLFAPRINIAGALRESRQAVGGELGDSRE